MNKIHWKTEQRDGAPVIGWIEAEYELRPSSRVVGSRYDDTQREIEAAYGFGSEITALLAKPGRVDPNEFRAIRLRLDRFIGVNSPSTGFHESLEAVRRRCEAAARGKLAAPPVSVDPKTSYTVALQKPAPDFVANHLHSFEQFRLSAARGLPVVLVFYYPGNKHALETLRLAEALQRTHAGKVTVVALSLATDAAAKLGDAKLTVLLVDGSAVRTAYGIEFAPRFLILDATGLVVWDFEGYGGETGYLANQQLMKLLKK